MNIGMVVAMGLLVAVPMAARASTEDFVLTGEGNTLTFSLPAMPVPTGLDGACPSGFTGEFCVGGVAVTVNGSVDAQTVEFFNAANGGGLNFADTGLPLFGDVVYGGTDAAPVFAAGTFLLTSGVDFADYSLAVTTEATPTPEPGSLVLLGTGVAGFGAWVRRRMA